MIYFNFRSSFCLNTHWKKKSNIKINAGHVFFFDEEKRNEKFTNEEELN
jgi:hypothetical protein